MTVVLAHRFLRILKNTGSASALGTLAYLEPSRQYFPLQITYFPLQLPSSQRWESVFLSLGNIVLIAASDHYEDLKFSGSCKNESCFLVSCPIDA